MEVKQTVKAGWNLDADVVLPSAPRDGRGVLTEQEVRSLKSCYFLFVFTINLYTSTLLNQKPSHFPQILLQIYIFDSQIPILDFFLNSFFGHNLIENKQIKDIKGM